MGRKGVSVVGGYCQQRVRGGSICCDMKGVKRVREEGDLVI